MTITVQIVNYNSKKHLRECLGTLRRSYSGKVKLEVLLMNNDSEDIRELVREQDFPFEVRLLEINENVGFGKAHNKGAESALGEYIIFLNPDTLALPGFLENMLEMFRTDPKIGIGGPMLIGENGRVNEEYCGYKKTPLSIVGRKLGWREPLRETRGPREVDWVSGGALMVRKELFFELGGFDGNYFMYFEDVDLCLQAKRRGHKVMVNPEAKIIHKSGKSFKNEKTKKRFYYASQNYYLKKNFGIFAAIVMRILRFPLYFKNVYLR